MQKNPQAIGMLVKMAVAVYPLLSPGETVQVNLPLSSLVGANGERPFGIISISKPTDMTIFQASNTPPPPVGEGVQG